MLVGPEEIIGALASITDNVIVHVLELVAASLAVSVTRWSPNASTVPGSGSCVTVTALHASVTVSSPVKSGIASTQFVPAASKRFVAHATKTGGVSSTTVKITDHAELKTLLSVTVKTTSLVPSGIRLPAN